MAADITPVVQAIESQTKTRPKVSELPDKNFNDEILKAITANTNNSEANTNALRVLTEKLNPTSATPSGESFAQKAFDTVKGVQNSLDDLYSYVKNFSNIKNPSIADLFGMQYKVTIMSLTMDAASKVGDKGSQAFQTLFRNQ
jgi:hypothetical protein